MSRVKEMVTGPYEVLFGHDREIKRDVYDIVDTRVSEAPVSRSYTEDDAQLVCDALNFHHNCMAHAHEVLDFTRPARPSTYHLTCACGEPAAQGIIHRRNLCRPA
jgi:hypothetical protein